MQFKDGTAVFTSTGEEVGHIDRVVIDPGTKEVTGIVVRKGFLFTEDKVVPISLIAAATDERVTLREDAGDLQALPDFEETHYIAYDDERARDGKLQLADLEGGSFTISNLGMYGIEQFVAVLNPPQVAILAVGSIEERPFAIDGELTVAPLLTMTLTCDHRAIDGSEGADFLRTVRGFVEAPALAL